MCLASRLSSSRSVSRAADRHLPPFRWQVSERLVDFSLVPEATVGDFVVIHSGFAISIVSRERAVETLEMLGLDSG